MQKKAIRYIHNASYNSHAEPLFKTYNILKLQDQYEYETLLFMHKYNRDVLTGYKTRQSNMIQIDRCYSIFSEHLPL